MVDHTIAKSVIRTTERMTYEDCNALLAHSDPALAERYARILPMLEDMAALSRVLEGRRRRRGALELDTRESYVVCDESGHAGGRGAPHAGAQRGAHRVLHAGRPTSAWPSI